MYSNAFTPVLLNYFWCLLLNDIVNTNRVRHVSYVDVFMFYELINWLIFRKCKARMDAIYTDYILVFVTNDYTC